MHCFCYQTGKSILPELFQRSTSFKYHNQSKQKKCYGIVAMGTSVSKIYTSWLKPTKRQVIEPLELVHNDICGKISEKSIGSTEYFMIFTDEKTH